MSVLDKLDPRPGLISVIARLKMKQTAEGGRTIGFRNGYRPNHVFEYDATGKLVCTFIGDVWFDGDGLFGPGEEKLVIVRFAAIQIIEQYMHQGRKWWLHEGRRVIAEAEILEVSSGLKDDARNNF